MSTFARCVYPNCSVLRPLGSMFLVCDVHSEKVEHGIECLKDFGYTEFVLETDARYDGMRRGLTRPAVRLNGLVYTVQESHRSPRQWEAFYAAHPNQRFSLVASTFTENS